MDVSREKGDEERNGGASMFLSIITPTYNRAYTLTRLYSSLVNQTDQDFEWVIINDGSTDNTEELINQFNEEGKIPIRYLSQSNGGKQRAHNKGVSVSLGELCICVDSDDALSLDAVETAKKIWAEADDKRHIGILAKRGDFDSHKPLCGDWPDELHECTMIELQEKFGFSGDTALFFQTKLMKKHYFQQFKDEKFVPEDSLYAELDNYGNMLLVKAVIYYCEYLPDGLTANYRQLLLDNPMGTSYCYYRRMLRSSDIKNKLKNAIISQAFLAQAGRKAEYKCDKQRLYFAIGAIGAPIYRRLKKMI